MTSQLPKFYKKNRLERLNILLEQQLITQKTFDLFKDNFLLDDSIADSLIENQLTQFHLPMGLALNFKIDGTDCLIPMVVEEPSVIAACSNAAKILSEKGFTTSVTKREMIGQIILKDISDFDKAKKEILDNENKIKELAQKSHPSIVNRGGGLQKISVKIISNKEGIPSFLTVYVSVDVKDAMGANIVNTILEGITPYILELTQGASLMSILSNYNTDSLVSATCQVPISDLDTPHLSGLDLSKKIVEASEYAKLDPYRAATHNKGIMNGIDSVVIATGNDPRAVESGAHAYASRSGQYEGMSNWWLDNNTLHGELTLPMAIGSVGGAISVLPMAKANLALMNVTSSEDLARKVVSVGIAQNFAALKALVSEGIQKGHMRLHASSLAIQIGAKEDEIEKVTTLLRKEKIMNSQIASDILLNIRSKKP